MQKKKRDFAEVVVGSNTRGCSSTASGDIAFAKLRPASWMGEHIL